MKRRMRRKIIAILTTVAMVLSLAPSALAGTFSDVPDNASYAGAVNRLADLGVLEGVGGGKYDPEGTYTRAQFAALVAKLMGLKSAADASKGATDFKDVPASHWASGYVNVASSLGIVKGYGDGTFKPDKLVNHAEALTMLVRALGYEPVLKGKWPANVLIKAAELGLTSGVTVVANLPASRAEVAVFANNAVDVPMMIQTGYGDQVKYVVSGTENTDKKTLLSSSATGKIVEGTLTATGAVLDSLLEDNEVTIHVTKENGKDLASAYDKTFKVGSSVNAAGMRGHDVKAVVRSVGGEDTIVGLTSQSEDKFIRGYLYSINGVNDSSCTGSGKIGVRTDLDKSSTEKCYSLASNADVYFKSNDKQSVSNLASVAGIVYFTGGPNGDNNYKGVASVALIRDNAGAVSRAIINTWGMSGHLFKEYNSNLQTLYWMDGGSQSLSNHSVTVVRDGKFAKVTDLQQGDLVYVELSSSDAVVHASSSKVAAKLSSASANGSKLTVGGTKYPTYINNTNSSTGSTRYSTDSGKTWTKAFSDVIGQDVTAYLDPFGYVAYVSAGQATAGAAKNYGLLITSWYEGPVSSRVYKVQFYNSSGTKVTAQLDTTTEVVYGSTTKHWGDADIQDPFQLVFNLGFGVYNTGDSNGSANVSQGWNATTTPGLIEYSLSSDGTKVSKLAAVDVHPTMSGIQPAYACGNVSACNAGGLTPDKDANTIKGDTNVGEVRVDSSTIIFDGRNPGDVKMLSWDGIKGTSSGLNGRYFADERYAKVIIINVAPSTFTAGLKHSVVTADPELSGSDTYTLTVNTAGETKTYTATTSNFKVTVCNDAACSSPTSGSISTDIHEGDVVTVEVAGSETRVKKLVADLSASGSVADKDTGTPSFIKVGGTWYRLADDAVVYVWDQGAGTVTKGDIGSVAVNDSVKLYCDGTCGGANNVKTVRVDR